MFFLFEEKVYMSQNNQKDIDVELNNCIKCDTSNHMTDCTSCMKSAKCYKSKSVKYSSYIKFSTNIDRCKNLINCKNCCKSSSLKNCTNCYNCENCENC